MKSIKRNTVLVLFISLVVSYTNAQEVVFGTNNYVEYQVGTLPLVISVPHGGNLEPGLIPNRTCNNPVYAVDAFTIETALEIKNKLFAATGCYPHMVISHLKRNKLDPNRNLADGACGNPEAILAWDEFHDFIADARNSANQQYNDQTFFVDLHGHGNPIQRIELGYLLYDDELELSDNTLNTTQYINYSSIKNLALNNVNNYTHAELLRGPQAFGTFLTNNNFPSVPSQSIPFPGITSNYFSGGYITANHTCYNPAAPINGLQMELNFSNLRDTPVNRSAFSNAFTQSIIEYFNIHFSLDLNSFNPLSTINSFLDKNFSVYPNPVTRGNLIHFNLPENTIYEYQLFNLLGQLVVRGELNSDKTLDSEKLISGVYIIRIFNKSSPVLMTNKIIIQ
jgi:N-formylglutamate amidohydrolase